MSPSLADGVFIRGQHTILKTLQDPIASTPLNYSTKAPTDPEATTTCNRVSTSRLSLILRRISGDAADVHFFAADRNQKRTLCRCCIARRFLMLSDS
ncbi:hypothetical protein GOP47_0005455 [Adiantum capillus-veneris]|uniref:Uncharacterized protein n=1 Tax=Adiantum capillus-veneris TaxID=13818 RepID=A0A9D4ZNK5_ADICA|nr:hypothetical protein GOP47_0005455 [Adiantum capillus-veneris]